ncbi:MAG: type II toxin-antitoxin system RelE/ParE family toxin [Bacteroidota bacterium]
MAKLILRQKAVDDLTSIWKYTFETWSENQADKYYESIKLACVDISKKPLIGKRYRQISENLRGYKINKHIIFYHSISNVKVEIVRILHERMDLNNQL